MEISECQVFKNIYNLNSNMSSKDDCIIVVKSGEATNRVKESITRFIES